MDRCIDGMMGECYYVNSIIYYTTVSRRQKKLDKDERKEISQEKELQSNYQKELPVTQENIKSLQDRLLDIESQQGRMDR